MGRVIPLHGDRHDEVRRLLPWFVTGRLDADERARVEAHLADCAECQAESRTEQALRDEVAGLSYDVESGWADMRTRLDAAGDRRPRGVAGLGRALLRPGRVGWLIAAQVALLFALGGLLLPLGKPDRYHALGDATVPEAGNVIVVFRPDIAERDMRGVLRASNARLVAGPTEADAYVLAVPAVDRPIALRRLRDAAGVVMAEPVG